MTFQSRQWPILDFDPSSEALLNPTHENLGLQVPRQFVMAFVGKQVPLYAWSHHARRLGTFSCVSQKIPIYQVKGQHRSIGICAAPVGAALAVQLLDWLIGYGAQQIIVTGSCGTLNALPENKFLIPTAALRDEGTSYHYLPPQRWVNLDSKLIVQLQQTLFKHGYDCTLCRTWTTDGFFRETQDLVNCRQQEGCSVVEMECAALAACAQFRKVQLAQLLYSADTLAAGQHQNRHWGRQVQGLALRLSIASLQEMSATKEKGP